jgi:regulator of replication initiation timing
MLHARLASEKKPTRDDVLDVLDNTKKIYEEALRLDNRVRALIQENLRLKYENEFMIRVLNEREEESC